MLVVNPIPEEYSMDETVINTAIDKALAEADEKGIKGKDVTPFLLDKIQRITGGDSLASNIQLVLNNARVASQIAVELSKLGR
jgi:pseudouridine-5'-phosphate glycosidase